MPLYALHNAWFKNFFACFWLLYYRKEWSKLSSLTAFNLLMLISSAWMQGHVYRFVTVPDWILSYDEFYKSSSTTSVGILLLFCYLYVLCVIWPQYVNFILLSFFLEFFGYILCSGEKLYIMTTV